MLGVALKQGFELFQYFRNKAVDQVDKVRDREQGFTHALEQLATQNTELMKINEKIDQLLVSNKDSIKSWIVTLYKQRKKDPSGLDSMQMDLLERRFAHYEKLGGNSYVDNLMQELREIYNSKEDNNASV